MKLCQFVDPDEFVKTTVERDPARWARFLLLASYAWEIEMMACVTMELKMLHALYKHHDGVFLPSLQSVTWRHADPTDTSVLLLCSPSLRSLEISTSRMNIETSIIRPLLELQPHGEAPDADLALAGIPHAAPFLRRFTLSGIAPRTGATVASYVSKMTNLHSLFLHNRSCKLNPDQMRLILTSIPHLETLVTRIADFARPETQVSTVTLRQLQLLESRSSDLLSLLSRFLQAPNITSLNVTAEDQAYCPASAELIPAIASTSFAPMLHSLVVSLTSDIQMDVTPPIPTNDANDAQSISANYPTLTEAVRPLLAVHALEDIALGLGTRALTVDDADLRALARAWPAARRIQVGWPPLGPRSVPPFTALAHFAELCPALHTLAFSKLTLAGAEDAERLEGLARLWGGHGLESLIVRTVSGIEGHKTGMVARFVNGLFPHLVLRPPPKQYKPRPGRMPVVPFGPVATWESVETELRIIRGEVVQEEVSAERDEE